MEPRSVRIREIVSSILTFLTMQCNLCGFEAESQEQYAGHRSAHVRRGELPKRPPKPTKHDCKFCGRPFKNGPALGAHVRHCGTPEMLAERLRNGQVGSGLRASLIRLGRKYECELCGQGPEWNGQPLTLQVDHRDGDRDNHDPENIRFLCPNCHTQTPTYGNKKRFPETWGVGALAGLEPDAGPVRFRGL